jgi:hypothetical protein
LLRHASIARLSAAVSCFARFSQRVTSSPLIRRSPSTAAPVIVVIIVGSG